jgi:hypothetical protein
MTISDILEQAKQLNPQERNKLIQELLELQRPEPIDTPKTGAELVAMLKKMEPIELVDPDIQDPVEWVKAQRRKRSLRPSL